MTIAQRAGRQVNKQMTRGNEMALANGKRKKCAEGEGKNNNKKLMSNGRL